MIVQRGIGDASTQPILTGAYWQQTWGNIPFWAWALGAAALAYFWPVSERERATGKPFGLGKRK